MDLTILTSIWGILLSPDSDKVCLAQINHLFSAAFGGFGAYETHFV